MKKWLLCSIFLLLSFVLLSNATADIVHEGEYEGFRWSLDDAGTLVVNGTGKITSSVSNAWYQYRNDIFEVEIKSGVTSTGSFKNYPSLRKVVLPEGLTIISASAFSGCTGLVEIDLPQSIKSIGSLAFQRCNSILEIDIPESVTSVGDSAFSECKAMLYAVLDSDGAKALGKSNYSFRVRGYDNNCLLRYLYSDGVVTDLVLQGVVQSASSVNIPDCIVGIDNDAFYQNKLTSIIIPQGVRFVGFKAFEMSKSLISVVFPDSVQTIGEYAFFLCDKLEYVRLPVGLNEIKYDFFYGCKSLKNVIIPDGVASLGVESFYNCSSLESITLPVSLKSIGKDAFKSCNKLKDVYYTGTEDDWVLITKGEGNSLLEGATIHFNASASVSSGMCGNNVEWNLSESGVLSISGSGDTFDYSTHGAPWYDLRNQIISVVIEDGITGIGDHFIEDCGNLNTVSVPESVYRLGFYAISNCDKINNLIIPGEISEMGYPVVYDCDQATVYLNQKGAFILWTLRQYHIPFVVMDATSDFICIEDGILRAYIGTDAEVNVPEGVKRIYSNAFSYNTGIESVVLPESVETIDFETFNGCSALYSIVLPETLKGIGVRAFADCVSLESITIPSGMHALDTQLFMGCIGLKEIHLPISMANINYGAFSGCESLEQVYYAGTEAARSGISINNEAGENQFLLDAEWIYGNESGEQTNMCGNTVSWLITDQGVLTISGTGDTFNYSEHSAPWYGYRDQIIGIDIEDGITGIGDHFFEDCNNLVSMTIPDSVYRLGFYAISNCDAITDITIPGEISEMGCPIVFDCDQVTVHLNQCGAFMIWVLRQYHVQFTVIDATSDFICTGDGTLRAYIGTDRVARIPDGVTRIYSDAFSYDTTIECVVMPEGLETIDFESFEGCSSLKSVVFPQSLKELGVRCFADCVSLESISLPSGVRALDTQVFMGCTELKRVYLPATFLSVSYGAFQDCEALTDVYFAGTEEQKDALTINREDNANDRLLNASWHYVGNHGDRSILRLPSSLSAIGDEAFAGAACEVVIIPDGCTSIGSKAFAGCDRLIYVFIPSSVKNIMSDAFEGCEDVYIDKGQ